MKTSTKLLFTWMMPVEELVKVDRIYDGNAAVRISEHCQEAAKSLTRVQRLETFQALASLSSGIPTS